MNHKLLKLSTVEKPKFSIVVRLLNELKDLPFFVSSLVNQVGVSNYDYELIFIDSGSSDGTLEYILGLDATVCSINKGDFNFGATCDLGVSLARSTKIFFFSAHVVLLSNSLISDALDLLKGDVVGISFKQVPNFSVGASEVEIAFLKHNYPSRIINFDISSSANPIFSNACSLINAGAKGYVPFGYKVASEDRIWADLMIRRGYKIIYNGLLEVAHSHNESLDQFRRRLFINYTELLKSGYKLNSPFLNIIKYFFGVLFYVRVVNFRVLRYCYAAYSAMLEAKKCK